MLVFVSFKFNANTLKGKTPFFLEHVVFLEATANVTLILLVVLCDLRLALLENLNLKATLSGPLLSQVLIELFNRLVLKVFDFSLNFVTIIDFL